MGVGVVQAREEGWREGGERKYGQVMVITGELRSSQRAKVS